MTEIATTPAELREREIRFDRRMKRRVFCEMTAGLLAAALLAWGATELLIGASSIAQYVAAGGQLLVVLGLGSVLHRIWQHHAKSRATGAAHLGAGRAESLLARLRNERDFLRDAWSWYVAPLVPGFVLMYAGFAFGPHSDPAAVILAVLATIAAMAGITWLNRRAASSLDRELRGYDESAA